MSETPFSPECEAVQPELNAYVDGELRPEERAEIERHLECCAACQAEVALLRLVTQSLGQAPRPEPSEAMRQRLLAQVTAELPPHRIEIFTTERHGDQVVRRREVRWSREPALRPQPEPAPALPIGLAVQQYRQASTQRPNCYQVIESHYGR